MSINAKSVCPESARNKITTDAAGNLVLRLGVGLKELQRLRSKRSKKEQHRTRHDR
jgi:hypothetical protein